jgi:hypothetical protein
VVATLKERRRGRGVEDGRHPFGTRTVTTGSDVFIEQGLEQRRGALWECLWGVQEVV